MFKNFLSIFFTALILSSSATADRIKDLIDVAGVRSNQVLGFGLVTGLQQTGDGKDLPMTAQALKTLLSGMGVSVDGPITDFDLGDQLVSLATQNAKKEVKVENVAAVMVTAEIPPFAKPGQKIDVSVSAIGVAKSLRGGQLIMTQLRGIDGETYAVAQGPLTLTGVSVDQAGSSVQIGVPTSGRIPNGATVERMVATPFDTAEHIVLNIREADFSTSTAITEAINVAFGDGTAKALDGVSIAAVSYTHLTLPTTR